MPSFKTYNTFSPNDSNTICAVTGFKVKRSEVMRRWEGIYVIPEAWHPRQPQDRPFVARPQKVFDNILTEDLSTDAVASFTAI